MDNRLISHGKPHYDSYGELRIIMDLFFCKRVKLTAKIELNLSLIRELKMDPSLEGWKPK